MPGARSSYTARTADYHVQYSDEHPWCGLDIFLPSGVIRAVFAWNRGGGNVSEPSVWDRWGYDPDANAGESGAVIEDLLEAGIAYVRVEYPNAPQPIHTARHHPTVREPHNWMFCQRAFQFMQTHALDGRITGSKSKTLPVDYRGYFFGGPSAGALNAGMVALSPSGHIAYDNLFRRNMGYFAVQADGRIKGAWMDDLPSEFMLYGAGLSANAMPFFGDTGRIQGDSFNSPAIVRKTRLGRIPRDDRRDIGMLALAQLRAEENQHVSLIINNSVNLYEASYFGSGLTFNVSNYTGDPTGATAITLAANSAVTAAVKSIVPLSGTSMRVFAEAGSSVFLRQWSGDLTLGGATITGYQLHGNDDRKTFISRQQSKTICEAANYGPFEDLISPHPVVGGGLLASEREAMFASLGVTNRDRYYLGSDYPAAISGDERCRAYVSNYDKAAEIIDWMAELGVDL